MQRLSEAEIERRLEELPGWTRAGCSLQRTFHLASFRQALAFVTAVGEKAEARDHHPDILVEFDRVTLTLTTHSAGGLTERDFDLAAEIVA